MRVCMVGQWTELRGLGPCMTEVERQGSGRNPVSPLCSDRRLWNEPVGGGKSGGWLWTHRKVSEWGCWVDGRYQGWFSVAGFWLRM